MDREENNVVAGTALSAKDRDLCMEELYSIPKSEYFELKQVKAKVDELRGTLRSKENQLRNWNIECYKMESRNIDLKIRNETQARTCEILQIEVDALARTLSSRNELLKKIWKEREAIHADPHSIDTCLDCINSREVEANPIWNEILVKGGK